MHCKGGVKNTPPLNGIEKNFGINKPSQSFSFGIPESVLTGSVSQKSKIFGKKEKQLSEGVVNFNSR